MDNTKSNKSRLLSPLHKANRQISLFMDERCRPFGFSGGELHMLVYIIRYGPCPVKELVRVFGHRPSTLTSMLDRLEKQGYIARRPNAEDRRSYLVAGTDKSPPEIDAAGCMVMELERRILERVSPEQMEAFHAVMDAIHHATQIDVRPPNPSPATSPPSEKT